MDAFNKKLKKDLLNDNLVIHWWNFGTKTLSYDGSVADYLKKQNVKISITTHKTELGFEQMKVTTKFSMGRFKDVKFVSSSLEDSIRMVINFELTYLGDKSQFILNGRLRKINH